MSTGTVAWSHAAAVISRELASRDGPSSPLGNPEPRGAAYNHNVKNTAI